MSLYVYIYVRRYMCRSYSEIHWAFGALEEEPLGVFPKLLQERRLQHLGAAQRLAQVLPQGAHL